MATITTTILANRGKLLLGLALVLAVVFQSREITAQPTQTQIINLNTGYNEVNSTLIPFLQQDDNWKVKLDPLNTLVPRPAIVVDNVIVGSNFKWPLPITNGLGIPSRWISADANKYRGVLPPPRTHFTYRTCFNLPLSFCVPKLNMQLRADDIIRQVRLNGIIIFNDNNPNAAASPAKLGSHLGPPLTISHGLLTSFRGGENCLEVDVEDVEQAITGLNVAGSMVYSPVAPLPPCPAGRGLSVVADLSTGTTGNPPSGIASGLADPKWFLVSSPTSPATPSAAFVTDSAWAIGNASQDAKWIQRRPGGTALTDLPGPYTYEVQFCLDTNQYRSIQLTLRYAADNSAIVRLNGVNIASCPGPVCYSTWQTGGWLAVSGPFSFGGLFPFITGVNRLDVVVTNNESLSGVIVDASLRLTCR